MAWLASLVHASGHAPIGLTSIGAGIALGVTLTAIAATLRVAGNRRLLISTIVFAIFMVFAEHAWLYLDFRRQWHDESAKSIQVAIFQREPSSPAEYFAHELTPQRATLWAVDAVIIVAGAVGTVFALRIKQR